MVKSKIVGYIISFSKLFIGLICVEYFPISNHIEILKDSKANWAIDTTFYAGIIDIISLVVIHQIHKKRLHISVALENSLENGLKSLTITEEPNKLFLELKIKGRNRKVGAPIFIRFPEWISVQAKNEKTIRLVSPNCILINVDEITGNSREIDIKRRIRIDIMSDTDEDYEEMTDTECKLKWWKKFTSIDMKFNRMKIKNKWR